MPFIPVLAGITAAFVVGTGIFLFSLIRLNNPFVRVDDVTVPKLVGLKYDTVRNSGNFSNFIIEMEGSAEYNAEYEKGVIFEQKPSHGRTVKTGAKITVRVSAGQEIVELPNFINQEATAVFAQLRDLNLKYAQVDVFSNTIPSGFVVATDPGAGSQIPGGSTVTVHVSMGPDSKVVEVPDLGGMSLEQARQELAKAGLNAGSINYRESEAESGTVIGQNPSPESQISEGAYVNLTVSSGDEEIHQITLYVRLSDALPNVVSVSATQNGTTVISGQQIQPSLVRVWKPTFVGTGTAVVEITVDGKSYMRFGLDFDNDTSTILEDHSEEFVS